MSQTDLFRGFTKKEIHSVSEMWALYEENPKEKITEFAKVLYNFRFLPACKEQLSEIIPTILWRINQSQLLSEDGDRLAMATELADLAELLINLAKEEPPERRDIYVMTAEKAIGQGLQLAKDYPNDAFAFVMLSLKMVHLLELVAEWGDRINYGHYLEKAANWSKGIRNPKQSALAYRRIGWAYLRFWSPKGLLYLMRSLSM